MMERIGRLFISISLFFIVGTVSGQVYPYKVAAKKDTVAIIKKIGGVNATTLGSIIALGDTSNTNEIQKIDTFAVVNDSLRISLTLDGEAYKKVALSSFDRQKADTFNIVSNILRLSLERDGIPFTGVNLAPYLDNTDGQTLSIAGNNLTISGGNTVTLPNTIYTGGAGINVTGTVITNTGDLSNTNELQTYSHAGTTSYTNTLSLGGGSFSLLAGSGIGISHTAGNVTVTATGSSVNIYNSNGTLTGNRVLNHGSFNLEYTGTGNHYFNQSGRIGWFLNTLPFTAFSNSTTGIQDQSFNNAAVDGILWQSFGTGYAGTFYGGFSHGFHTRTNGNTISSRILNCSSGSSAVDRFTVFGNGTVRVQGLPNVAVLGTNASGDLQASTAWIQTYSHSGTTSYTNTLSGPGGAFTLTAGSGISLSHNGFGTTTISAAGSSGWALLGNAGTNPSSNFVGTTDAQDLAIRTQSTEVLRFKVGGLIGQGTTAPSFPYHMLMVGSNGFMRQSSGTVIRDSWKFSGGEFYIEGTNSGVSAPTLKLYASTNSGGGFLIENNNAQMTIGSNFMRNLAYPSTRNDLASVVPTNQIYTDGGGFFMSAPIGSMPVETANSYGSSPLFMQQAVAIITVPGAGNFTVDLAGKETNGRVVYVKRNPASAGAGNVIVNSSNGRLIDNAASYTLNTTNSGATFIYSTSLNAWFVYGRS